MRNLIVTGLLLYFILSLTFQSAMERANDYRTTYIEDIIQTNLAVAAIKGYFTSQDITNIQDQVANVLGYSVGHVYVNGTTTPEPRGSEIELEISIPTRVMLLPTPGVNNAVTITRFAYRQSEALNP